MSEEGKTESELYEEYDNLFEKLIETVDKLKIVSKQIKRF